MTKTLFIFILAMTIPALSGAQGDSGHQCTLGDLTRSVEIIYETGVTVPCEVHYVKETEAPGERQVLWRAVNEEGFCEARTAAFIAKLSSMGWNCGAAAIEEETGMGDPLDGPMNESDAAMPDDTEMSDDTDALAPAKEQ